MSNTVDIEALGMASSAKVRDERIDGFVPTGWYPTYRETETFPRRRVTTPSLVWCVDARITFFSAPSAVTIEAVGCS